MVPRSPKKAKTVASLAKGRDSHVEEDQFDFSDVGEAGQHFMSFARAYRRPLTPHRRYAYASLVPNSCFSQES